MFTIDADAHVIENESTWDYMLESEKAFKPKVVGATNGKDAFDYWMIDGRVIPRNNVGRDLPVESREMSDLSARIKHMDELGIDFQVIYPTFFITSVSRRPDIDLAVSRSYNRWMADIVKKQPDRFRWVLVPPLQSTEHLSEELKFGKEHGACAAYTRALPEKRPLTEPYYDPLGDNANRWGQVSLGYRPFTTQRSPRHPSPRREGAGGEVPLYSPYSAFGLSSRIF